MFEFLSPLLYIALWWSTLSTGAKWAYASAFIVLLGVTGESVADLTEWIKDKSVRTRVEKASALILILGLTGDLVSISIGQIELETLTRVAGDATKSAKDAAEASARAKASVDELSTKAADLTARLDDASRQLSHIEEDVATEGPRWQLLLRAAPRLITHLTPFAGQKVDMFTCGPWNSTDWETKRTWARLADILWDKGAKWKVGHGGVTPLLTCDHGEGIWVGVSKLAPKNTSAAATALALGIASTLGKPFNGKVLGIVDPDVELTILARSGIGEGSPRVAVARDPDLIVVFIGSHPQFPMKIPTTANKQSGKP